MALTDNLVAYWKLEETSGTRVDAHGANDLTDTNTVTSGTGKVGTAADFESGTSEYLTIANNADVNMNGNQDFTIAAWVNLESVGAKRPIVSKQNDGSNGSYDLRYENTNTTFNFRTWGGAAFGSPGGTGGLGVFSSNFGTPSLATWYFIVAWHDATADTINIQVNDGTANSGAHTAGIFNESGAFDIGASHPFSEFFDGLIDEVGIWKRVLTSDERTFLYNGGAGRTYEDFLATIEQEGYRWRDDDGDEDAATWLDAQDTDITRAKNTNTRLRTLLNATNDPETKQFQLEYRKVGDTEWHKITTQ